MSFSLIWFRQDLRLRDNPALCAAVESRLPVIPIYILDDENAGPWKMGGASRFWLYHSLNNLNKSLGQKLVILKGKAQDILPRFVAENNIKSVHWNRCYEPWRIERDKDIKKILTQSGVDTQSHNGSLLWEPWDILKSDGEPYKVFTPFYRKGCLNHSEPRLALPAPAALNLGSLGSDLKIEDLELLPKKPQPRWDLKMEPYWMIGEDGAEKRLQEFLKNGLHNYKDGRNIPAEEFVSRLSPHLHFGEISPHHVWHAAKIHGLQHTMERDLDHFHSELGWREFSHYLLYHFPHLPDQPFNARFSSFPWHEDMDLLKAWKFGRTGYPIVDAGMRELYETGYMHNRVRMIVGSFLVKHLLLHWHHGEAWFWDKLVDADLANNSASWQWVAGCGADAAPYFRIFNPVLQGEKFDPKGAYVRRWVPELIKLPDDYIHKPWDATELILKSAGIELGKNYPHPIVGLTEGRDRALKAFQDMKEVA